MTGTSPHDPLFTIMLPVTRPPALLPFAVESVKRQLCDSWELFIICDGGPPGTGEMARQFAADDPRIRARVHPKGQRHGEAYRHLVLQEARGQYVAQIADDDLWFPDHLTELERLLREVDFGATLSVNIDAQQVPQMNTRGFDSAEVRQQLLVRGFTIPGPTPTGYRMSAYHQLPEGWAPAPEGVPTDIHMWRKFIRVPGLTFGTRFALTAINFGSPNRTTWTLEQREEETRRWFARFDDDGSVRDLRAELLATVVREAREWRAFKLTGRHVPFVRRTVRQWYLWWKRRRSGKPRR
ncbi:MAG: glycosyltransferase family 2 protein [Planctomycetota bacterium]